MHLRLGDKRQRDWMVAAVLAAASLLQLSLGPGRSTGRCSARCSPPPSAPRSRSASTTRPLRAIAAQGISALDLYTWHNLQAGGWTIAWFCSLYGLAVWASRWPFVAGTAFVGLTDLLPVGRDANPANWNNTAVGFALGTVVVMVVIRRIVGDRDSRARLAERERDVAAREAVVEERARIARELHDAVAHSVSMMVIQAGAERRLVEDGSTREVLQTIEQIGRSALTEMRRLVGMLRTDSSERLAPQPTLADLPMLMTQVREAGLPVEFRVDGQRRELPVGIELSAYRIVQEALTNALKHAGRAHAASASGTAPTRSSSRSPTMAPGPQPTFPAAGTAWPGSASASPCTEASSTRPPARTAASPSGSCCRFDILPRLKAGDSSYYADWSSS